jgi:hypothetical protein
VANGTRSSVRAQFEHVFGHQDNSMGVKIVRSIGQTRAIMKIVVLHLANNISRVVALERSTLRPA